MKNVIRKYAGLPFSYGTDCCAFAGECVEELTGINPMQKFSYANESEALQIIESYGDLETAITATLGEPYDGMKEGDVCLINTNDGKVAAAIVFNERIVARVAGGLMDYPLSRALKVWAT